MVGNHKTVTVFLLILLQGCDSGYDQVASLGTLERDRIELTAESNEPLTAVFVQEGDIVVAGKILLQQDTSRASLSPFFIS